MNTETASTEIMPAHEQFARSGEVIVVLTSDEPESPELPTPQETIPRSEAHPTSPEVAGFIDPTEDHPDYWTNEAASAALANLVATLGPESDSIVSRPGRPPRLLPNNTEAGTNATRLELEVQHQ